MVLYENITPLTIKEVAGSHHLLKNFIVSNKTKYVQNFNTFILILIMYLVFLSYFHSFLKIDGKE